MTTLAKDSPRKYGLGDKNGFGIVAATTIYEGSAIGLSAGYARPLQAGDRFVGFADHYVENPGGAGAVNVTVFKRGEIQLSIANLAITDVGLPVYASDDDTFTLTATGNSYIGKVVQFESAGVGMVAFDTTILGTLTALTDNSGGVANTTLEACGAAVTGVDGVGSNAASKADVDARLTSIKNNFADLAAMVNALIALTK